MVGAMGQKQSDACTGAASAIHGKLAYPGAGKEDDGAAAQTVGGLSAAVKPPSSPSGAESAHPPHYAAHRIRRIPRMAAADPKEAHAKEEGSNATAHSSSACSPCATRIIGNGGDAASLYAATAAGAGHELGDHAGCGPAASAACNSSAPTPPAQGGTAARDALRAKLRAMRDARSRRPPPRAQTDRRASQPQPRPSGEPERWTNSAQAEGQPLPSAPPPATALHEGASDPANCRSGQLLHSLTKKQKQRLMRMIRSKSTGPALQKIGITDPGLVRAVECAEARGEINSVEDLFELMSCYYRFGLRAPALVPSPLAD